MSGRIDLSDYGLPDGPWENHDGLIYAPPESAQADESVLVCEVPFEDQRAAFALEQLPALINAMEGLLANSPAPKAIRADFSYTLHREAARSLLAKLKGGV